MMEQAETLLFFIPEECLFNDIEEGVGEKIEEVIDDPNGQRKRKEDDHAGRERFFHKILFSTGARAPQEMMYLMASSGFIST